MTFYQPLFLFVHQLVPETGARTFHTWKRLAHLRKCKEGKLSCPTCLGPHRNFIWNRHSNLLNSFSFFDQPHLQMALPRTLFEVAVLLIVIRERFVSLLAQYLAEESRRS